MAKRKLNWQSKLWGTVLLAAIILGMYLLKMGCPILRLTGVPCPGCGMTRAVVSLLKGHVKEALAYHAMVWSLPILYLYFLFDGKLFSRRWLNLLLPALIGLGFLVNWAMAL